MRSIPQVVVWVACVAAGVGAWVGTASPAWAQDATLPEIIRTYQADARYVARFHAVDWSEARFDRLDRFYDETLAALDDLDYDALGVDDRIDWHLLRRHVTWRRSSLDMDRRRLAEMEPLLPFRGALQALELSRRAMEECDPASAAAVLAEATRQAKDVRSRVEAGRKPEDARGEDALTPSPVLAVRAAGALHELATMLDRWAGFYEEFRPDFGWWTRRPREDCQRELRDLAKYLREEIAGVRGKDEDPLIGDPIGEDALRADLEGEALCYTPDELIAIGERELAWCEAELRKAAESMGFADWREALARVKAAHVPPGEQAAFVRDTARAAIAFLKDRDLVTIPPLCEEAWRVEMHSVETQRTLPFAVYGGQYMGVSYAAGSMGHDDKIMSMRGNNRHFTHIVTPHELFPGHHLQKFMEARARAYRGLFSTPFLVEGWALYWEFRLWDLGWAGATGHEEAMDRVGMLFWRSHRAARIIVSLRYHLGRMTPQEMIDFLVERVGHERIGATAEVRRYIGSDYSPLYQCGYMLGGLQVHAMHREFVEQGGMTDKAFNDAVLGEGSIPIELMRAALRREVLPKDWTPTWRFGE